MGSTLIDITSEASGAASTIAAAPPAAAPAVHPPTHTHHFEVDHTLIPFKLADIGEGIAEVELMKWFVKVT